MPSFFTAFSPTSSIPRLDINFSIDIFLERLIASIIIWGLNYYPNNSKLTTHSTSSVDHSKNTEMNYSYLEQFGRFIEPVMAPLGFDWKMTVSIIAGIPGKEIVVSTLGVLYESNGSSANLGERLKSDTHDYGQKVGQNVYNPAVALAFLMFILIYFPCIAVIATIAKESGSLFWPAFITIYTSVLAWSFSFLVYKAALFLIN